MASCSTARPRCSVPSASLTIDCEWACVAAGRARLAYVMAYRVRSELSYCSCEGRPIFLDIDTRRYSTLPVDLCEPFAALIGGDENVPHSDIERLSTLGVIEPGTPVIRALSGLAAPTSEVSPLPCRFWSIGALLAQAQARCRLRRQAFRNLLADEAAQRPAERTTANDEDWGRLRGAFEQIATLYGEVDQCLPRSLAFRRLALKRGHNASLVIGVKIDPFAAHCWVQSGPRVTSDSLERVSLFTPIHAII